MITIAEFTVHSVLENRTILQSFWLQTYSINLITNDQRFWFNNYTLLSYKKKYLNIWTSFYLSWNKVRTITKVWSQ